MKSKINKTILILSLACHSVLVPTLSVTAASPAAVGGNPPIVDPGLVGRATAFSRAIPAVANIYEQFRRDGFWGGLQALGGSAHGGGVSELAHIQNLQKIKTEQKAGGDNALRLEAARGHQKRKTVDVIFGHIKDLLAEKNLKNLVVTMVVISVASTASFYGIPLLVRIIDRQMTYEKPKIIKDTNIVSYFSKFYKMLGFWPKQDVLTIDDVVLHPALMKDLKGYINIAKNGKKKGLPFPNLLFYGPAGTGKTLTAKIIAEMSGMDYMVIPGSALSQLPAGKDIAELSAIFDYAKNSRRGLIIFVDEADSLLSKRKGTDRTSDDRVNHFLSRFERANDNHIMLILATNLPDKLDPDILSRISERVYFPLPDFQTRGKILLLHLKKEVVNDEEEDGQFVVDSNIKTNLKNLANLSEGLSGRDINEAVLKAKRAMILEDQTILTYSMLEHAIKQSLKQKQAFQHFLINGNGPELGQDPNRDF